MVRGMRFPLELTMKDGKLNTNLNPLCNFLAISESNNSSRFIVDVINSSSILLLYILHVSNKKEVFWVELNPSPP